MKIAFIYMNSEFNVGRGAGYVVGAILKSGYSLDFFDSKIINHSIIINKILTGKYDIVMISSMTLLFSDALNIIKSIKSKKNIPILVGGIHVTAVGENILKDNKEIDYLCIGEGESFVVEFLEKFKKGELELINNLIYRSDNKINSNPIRDPEDLSILPEFPWNLFNKDFIVKNNGMSYVTATRGCPYSCTYCCNSIYLDIYKKSYMRKRPIKQVINELKFLRDKYKPKIFYFGDEMIFFDENYAKELFSSIYSEVKVPYGGMGRVESMNEDMVKHLKNTGCKYLAMGIECGDEEFRKTFLNRYMSNEKIKTAFKLCRENNIFTTSFNIIGYPVENDNELTEKTIKFNQEVKPSFSQVTIFYPFVGTKLYDYCIERNLIEESKTTQYYNESVIKGKKVLSKMKQMNKLLNPNGLTFKI